MKKFFAIITIAAVLTSCGEKNWDDQPDYFGNENNAPHGYPYGNDTITCHNRVSINRLKERYADVIASGKAVKIEDDIQIRGYVNANDIESNVSNQIGLEDKTGAIIVAISETGICSYLPVGEEIVVNLKGLYIGGYYGTPQIGAPYNSTIGRMNKYDWYRSFRILSEADASRIVAKEITDFAQISDDDLGKIITLKNVTFFDADGKSVFAPDNGVSYVEQKFKEMPNNLVIRTSAYYSKFANEPLPTYKVDVTGICTRYNKTWQIYMRTFSDMKKSE